MRVWRAPEAIGNTARRLGSRHRTVLAVVGGVVAVLPTALLSSGTTGWLTTGGTQHVRDATLGGGYDPGRSGAEEIGVDGSLPDAPQPLPLPAYELPDGPLGIPVTALAAYHQAADILAKEQPACHIDWALIASIGRIESNHARGGYVDQNGTTLEPILGPELNGQAGTAAIPDTDQGVLDGDTVWDRAVGPTQFIPATWRFYASDGNGDGKSDPNNIFDSALATGRFLCAGGYDLANPDQLRAAIYRYNNSDTYVNTVILWAEAYRKGIMQVPDSTIPVGAPNAAAGPPPPSVPPPPVPPVTITGGPSTPPSSTSQAPSDTSKSPTGSPSCTNPPTTITTTTTVPSSTTTPPPTTTSPSGSSVSPTPPPPPPSCGATITSTATVTATSSK